MLNLRIYIDTSVFGGCFDTKSKEDSIELFELIKSGKYTIIISDHLIGEISKAPDYVKNIFESIPDEYIEYIEVNSESLDLQKKYIEAGILGTSSMDDALHVAIASVARVDLIVSWNFRHIVHYDKIRQFNAVNLFNGYPSLDIRSPKEVI